MVIELAAAQHSSGENDTQEASRKAIFRELLNHGADANRLPAGPKSTLSYAVWWDMPDIVQMLLQNGTPVDEMDAGCEAELLDSKINRSVYAGSQAPGMGCDTELMVCDGEDMTHLLLRYGADPNARGEGGLTPVLWQCSGCYGPADIAKIRFLLANGADPNAKDDDGDTALMCAAKMTQANTPQIIGLLCEYGADTTQKDSTGKTALDIVHAISKEDVSPAVRRGIVTALTNGIHRPAPTPGRL